MSIFCFKKLPATTSLGAQLRARREERGVTIADIASATHIQKKYLHALEQGNARKLPKSKTFRLGYVREYAQIVGLTPAECVEQFQNEGGLEDITFVHPQRAIKLSPFASIMSAVRIMLLGGGVLLFGVYLAVQVVRIVRPPHLVVYSPTEGDVLSQLSAIIQGETEQEATLSINGQEAMVNEQGKFETKIDLTQGVNTITISATNKHGKSTVDTRHIVVRLPKKVEQISLKDLTDSDSVTIRYWKNTKKILKRYCKYFLNICSIFS